MPPEEVEAASPSRDIQALFLNGARRERLDVTIQLVTGVCIEARIKSFDRFAVVVDRDGSDELIFKHAIASIRPARAGRSAAPVP
jgi:host factor-I protein